MAALPLQREIDYPESDGRPLGETDWHRQEIVDLIHALQERYEDVPDIYVSGNLLLYYVKDDVSKSVCPDVFLVEGISKEQRPIYKLWEEGKGPSLVIEMASKKTWEDDLDTKKAKYARIGVLEYFLFDPIDQYLDPRLQGFRLLGNRYRPIPAAADGSLVSQVAGLRLSLEGMRLRLVDLASGEPLLWTAEEREARKAAEAARNAAEAQRDTAEAQRAIEQAAREAAEAARNAAVAQRAIEQAAREAAEAARNAAVAQRAIEQAAREAAEAKVRAAEEEILRLRRALDEHRS
jgi:Uma2 family endonuclease